MATQAHALCSNPADSAGKMRWNPAKSRIEYCNGTNWISTRLAPTASACATAGKIRYTGSDLQHCDGSVWVSMSSGTSSGSCSTAGSIHYNNTTSVYEWCDGAHWIVMQCTGGTFNLTISANTLNYDIFETIGRCSGAATVTLTINSGVVVGSSSTSAPALDTGSGWAAGSSVTIINNGKILGAGGAGGNGGAGNASGNAGTAGADGGLALAVQYPVTITNNGVIAGGGGGGGGGAGD